MNCSTTFLGIAKNWWAYLPKNSDCTPKITSISQVLLIILAVIDILLAVAGIVAVFFVIYGGVMFITSGGNPEQAKKAQKTLINALIGLVIAISAASLVTFLAGSF